MSLSREKWKRKGKGRSSFEAAGYQIRSKQLIYVPARRWNVQTLLGTILIVTGYVHSVLCLIRTVERPTLRLRRGQYYRVPNTQKSGADSA